MQAAEFCLLNSVFCLLPTSHISLLTSHILPSPFSYLLSHFYFFIFYFFIISYHPPTTQLVAESAAVSDLSLLGPNEIGMNPFFVAAVSSRSVKPPSGPITRSTDAA